MTPSADPPMMLREGINLHLGGVRAMSGRRGTWLQLSEAAPLAARFGGYLTAVFGARKARGAGQA